MKAKAIEPYRPRSLERSWGTETFVAETPHYLGKVLRYAAGKAGGLQYHTEKDETFYLLSGEALVDFDDQGRLQRTRMRPGMSFHIPPGAPHRFTALTDCVVIEASTPHYEDRVRVEAQYGEPEVEGLPSTREPKRSLVKRQTGNWKHRRTR